MFGRLLDVDEPIALWSGAVLPVIAAVNADDGVHRGVGAPRQIGLHLGVVGGQPIAGAKPGPEGNVTKLLVAESSQHLTELGIALAGSAAVVGANQKLIRSYMGSRAMTIAGGTSEITRNT